MDQPQLLRRRRHARRQVLLRVLRILLVVLVATVTQVALPYTVSRTLSFANAGFGLRYMQDLISNPGGYGSRIFRTLRMSRMTFLALERWMRQHTHLRDSRQSVLLREKLGIYLYIVGQGASFRLTAETFRRSINTIHRVFHEVLRGMNELYLMEVRLPTIRTPPASRIRKSGKFWPYFKDCIGALDGSHIHAFVPGLNQGPYRNRKGYLSQNVLAVCDFNMMFIYILAGWEGTANDARVLSDAINRGFHAPPGKYYLADAGYSNTPLTMTPYRGVRYHLKEQARASLKPQTKEELYNLRHASLRNVIERQFGVLKRRFKLIRAAPEYPLPVQVRLIYALTGLNNFIARNNIQPDLYQTEGYRDHHEVLQDLELDSLPIEPDSPDMDVKRDGIAIKMWADYCRYVGRLEG